jgi:thioredoxin reductase (NADPH)
MVEKARLIVIGAGPAGLATAVEARAAGIDPVIILERKDHLGDTIVTFYHEGKRVDPIYRKVEVEPKGMLSFDTETKEAFLQRMRTIADDHQLDIRHGQEVQKVIPQGGFFNLYTSQGLELQAPLVVVAIGIYGRPIKPSYPILREVKDKVHFSLPKELPSGKRVLVVGGGDAAAESAVFLSGTNEVTLSYRKPEFIRLNELNYCSVNDCANLGTIKLMLGTDIQALESCDSSVKVHFKHGEQLLFDFIFYNFGGATPKVFLESIGVEFADKMPVVDGHGESNIPRLFLAGDLVVESGTIMAAFNSGKTVVERITSHYAELVRAPAYAK